MRKSSLNSDSQLIKGKGLSHSVGLNHSDSSAAVELDELDPVVDNSSPRDLGTLSTIRKEVLIFETEIEDYEYPTAWESDAKEATCPHCRHTAQSKVSGRLSCGAVICACCLTVTGLCWTVLCLPCCRDYVHKCTSCGKTLGVRTVL